MSISDWSSDVCSSDLNLFRVIIVRQSPRLRPLAIRKDMFQRIGDKLRHQQAQRNGKIQINVQRTGINYKLNACGCTALNDVAREFFQKRRDVEGLQIPRRHKLLMHQPKGIDAAAQGLQRVLSRSEEHTSELQ